MDEQILLERITEVLGNREQAQAVVDIVHRAKDEESSRRRALLHEGIETARSKGVKFGRPKLVLPDTFPEICRQHQIGTLTIVQAAQILHISPSSFQKLYKQYRQEHS